MIDNPYHIERSVSAASSPRYVRLLLLSTGATCCLRWRFLVLCAVAAALAGSSCWLLLAAAGCCCELLRTHEHLLLTALLGWLFNW